LDAAARQFVRERAANRCEYCQLTQENSPLARLQIEHIVPRKQGGSDLLGNLALACIDCNLRKGSNLSGIDPVDGTLTRLFHPREDTWGEHFEWDEILLVARTGIGRVTIGVLDLNSEDRLLVRTS